MKCGLLLYVTTFAVIVGKMNAGNPDKICLLKVFLLYNLAQGVTVAQLCGWSEGKQTFFTQAPSTKLDF